VPEFFGKPFAFTGALGPVGDFSETSSFVTGAAGSLTA